MSLTEKGVLKILLQPARSIILITLVLLGLLLWFVKIPFATYILLGITIIGGLPTIWSGLRALITEHRISIDTFNAFALLAAYFTQESSSAAMIVLMLQSAALLEWKTRTRSENATKALLALKPRTALREENGVVNEVSVDDVRVGDILLVKEGERIPVDGEIISGTISIDESPVTGESVPRDCTPGDEVYGITVIVSGHMRMRAVHVGEDATFARMAALIRDAQKNKSHTQKIADRFAAFFLPGVLIGGIAVYLIFRDISMVIAFFLVACADDIAVSIPLAITAALGKASKKGILIKGGKWLEVLSRVSMIVLDKTGTLTNGDFSVRAAKHVTNISENDFWTMVGAAEKLSAHPIGQAVHTHARTIAKNIPEPENFTVHKGSGVTATVGTHVVAIGDDDIVDKIDYTPTNEEWSAYQKEKDAYGQTTFMVIIDHALAGFITVADMPKEEAKESIVKLRSMNIDHVAVLTGDDERVARDVARTLDIDEVYASLTPEDKVHAIEKYTQNETVAMIGDGINDAPSLARAHVGIAMGTRGTAVALESADVVILEDHLDRVPFMIKLGRRTLSVIRWNIGIWVITNLLGFTLVIIGVLDPIGAAIYNFATDFLPLINATRLFGNAVESDYAQTEQS